MSCIKSIQRGTGNSSTTSFTINEVDPEKCVVLINPITTTTGASVYGSWASTYAQVNGGAVLSSITATNLTFSNVRNTFGWQLIEFA